MPPLGRTTSSMEERRTQLQELSAAASDLLAGAEIPQLGRTASSMEECRTQLQELRAAASNLIAGAYFPSTSSGDILLFDCPRKNRLVFTWNIMGAPI
eukprot:COSAG05_NODE_600_length_8422_cov_35.108615_6_plen_98_part_00